MKNESILDFNAIPISQEIIHFQNETNIYQNVLQIDKKMNHDSTLAEPHETVFITILGFMT